MTPTALIALVARALGRPGARLELEDWGRVLAHVPDDVADQALLDHRASSTYPPTVADVRRHATLLLNDRAMRAEAEQRRRERETGMTADGKPLVPMPEQVRAAAAELSARQRARDVALNGGPEVSGPAEPLGVSPQAWPCCAHCPGSAHPPHRTACDSCAAPPVDAATREGELA
jgi:hypothetical protein